MTFDTHELLTQLRQEREIEEEEEEEEEKKSMLYDALEKRVSAIEEVLSELVKARGKGKGKRDSITYSSHLTPQHTKKQKFLDVSSPFVNNWVSPKFLPTPNDDKWLTSVKEQMVFDHNTRPTKCK